MKHVHILGICGTFMAGIAVLAKQLNFKVTGSDLDVYPPMSDQLANLGITLYKGYGEEQLDLNPDIVIVGNVMTRGMPVIEAMLDRGIPYISGPEWLYREVLSKKQVLAVSGTHGKTTTSSLLAWILDCASLRPGFLIGGIPNNFEQSARLGEGPYFVIEADEYDCAFFDKRSKFVHYHPKTLILNNLEYDHADIFPNLAAIQTQFHHLIRTIPSCGTIIYPADDQNIKDTLEKGCWSRLEGFHLNSSISQQSNSSNEGWFANPISGGFQIGHQNQILGTVQWGLQGNHNILNALAAVAAAVQVGVPIKEALDALHSFKSVKRRMEEKGFFENIIVYDDFAHHPTAIETTLLGLRDKVGKEAKIIAILDIRSNTMRAGHHEERLPLSFEAADVVFWYKPKDVAWSVESAFSKMQKKGGVFEKEDALLEALCKEIQMKNNDKIHVLFMSNGGFGGIQNRFLELLKRETSKGSILKEGSL